MNAGFSEYQYGLGVGAGGNISAVGADHSGDFSRIAIGAADDGPGGASADSGGADIRRAIGQLFCPEIGRASCRERV